MRFKTMQTTHYYNLKGDAREEFLSSLPIRFNCPYYYEPHPLCTLAAAEVQAELSSREDWREEIGRGKMFGVLAVRDGEGRVAYIKAYSGQIGGRADWPGWVPAVFDYLNPEGYFCREESQITEINHMLRECADSKELKAAEAELKSIDSEASEALTAYRTAMAEAKQRRDEERSRTGVTTEAMIRESQYQKAELRRMRLHWDERKAEAEARRLALRRPIDEMRQERQQRSEALQQWLFSQFVMVNARGETRSLLDIFSPTPQRVPPSGAGECCAPKLLQYAFTHGMTPLAMAEFWWGESPSGELRRHLDYYPACQGKCRPILDFMLQGMDVEPNALEEAETTDTVDILYEDEWLLAINKPAGMLSVPGRNDRDSAIDIVARMRPDEPQPYAVHRLDMATSGILLLAKSEDVQRIFHSLFAQRSMRKTYIAVVEGEPKGATEGTISLPLSADYINRPRQRVDLEKGKESVTEYRIIGSHQGRTRLELHPLTGRTHQLRVHCASPSGLACPIVCDSLYGHRAGRLLLHAERIEFIHPFTSAPVAIVAPCPF